MTTEPEYQEAGAIVPVQSHNLVEWTPRFAVAVDEAIERKAEKRRFFENVMDEGLHYGVIPGTKTKPTLLKPGAEMLLSNMGLNQEFSDSEPPIRDYDGSGAGNGEPMIAYRRVCRIYRQTGPQEQDRMLVAKAEGFCTSREEKYRYRKQRRLCPQCGKATIIKGKEDYGGGWICWKKEGKSDGCGAKFRDGDASIESQPEGQSLNPNIADSENTVLKMADKRALVAATLLATGCSDIFTQDVEDALPEPLEAPLPPKPVPPRTPRPASASSVNKAVPSPAAEASHSGATIAEDPVLKGKALDALANLRRERFISPTLLQALLLEMVPHRKSEKTGTVSEGDLTIPELREVYGELQRRTKFVEGKPVGGGRVDLGETMFDGLEDEIPL